MPKHSHATLGDTLANLIGDAVQDIRQKVVEEAWFGREVTSGSDSAINSISYQHLTLEPSVDYSHINDMEIGR